jgi:hypothetical protein
MQRKWILCAGLTAVMLLPGSAAARWYQVEVIVFQQLEAMSAGGEQWPELDSLPEFGRAMELIVDLPEMSDEPPPLEGENSAAEGPIAFTLLDTAERTMTAIERRLRLSREYRPLIFAAWRQPSFGVRRAKRIYLSDVDRLQLEVSERAGDAGGGELIVSSTPRAEGIVQVKIGRLLHVDVDFLYYHEGTPVRLTETRKLKLNEIHYFDHPLFGVIVQVSPYVLPDAQDEPDEVDTEDAPAPS